MSKEVKEANIEDVETLSSAETNKKPIRERFLLIKIDVFVLSFVCLQYWINYVDRVGFSNAYISGMKEDLNMKGDDLNVTNTCFTVGYIIGMIPNNLMLLIVPPRVWLSFCTFSWGLLTLGMYRVSSYQHCCVLRFFQALFESCTFAGTHLILGSWYKEHELPIRSAIFTSSGLIGSMFSGFMQVKIFNNLNGVQGLAGWRWLFIIDFCITVPIAIYGFVFFPGVPDANRDGWLDKMSMSRYIFSEDELKFARRRLPARDETTRLDWSVVTRVLKRWHWYLFSLVWVFGGENLSFASNTTFALWLTNQGYSLTNRNNFPSGIYAVGIVSTVASAVYLTKFRHGRHWHIAMYIAVVMCVVAIMIRSKATDAAVMFTAQYLGGVAYAGQAVFFAWANVVCHEDLQERAIVLASMNMFSSVVNAWWSILFYAATMVPHYKNGCYAMIATAVASGVVSITIRTLQVRDNKQKKALPYIDANDVGDSDGFDDSENEDAEAEAMAEATAYAGTDTVETTQIVGPSRTL